jgi:hypothetical protein
MDQVIVVYEGEILITVDADDLEEMTAEELADTIAMIRHANATDNYEDFEIEDDDDPAPEIIRKKDMQ